MKHTPASLLERAAELYDFGAVLRAAPAPAAVPRPAPAPTPEPASKPAAAERVAPAPVAPVQPAVRAVAAAAVARPAAGPIAAVDRQRLAQGGFIVPEAPATGIAEEFRLLKHRFLADIAARTASPEEQRRTALICADQAGAGKTFCAINLALSLAGEQGVEVLLIDADFAKPDLLETLGLPGDGPGLVDALADSSTDPESFVIRTDIEGLCVLPAGRKANNVPELLASDRSREVLAKLAAGDRRRIILFDSPPVLMASHATVLAGLVGQALVVVRADHTTEADLRETIGLLSKCGHVGLILNAAGLTGRKFGAYNGYGHDQ